MEPTAALVTGGDDAFLVHTKHTCDACLVQPILGKRYASDRADFDLCARCFAAYRGPDVGLAVAALVRDKKHSRDFALKLRIDHGGNVQLRRVKVSEIWDKSTSALSFSSLMYLASGYVWPKGKDGEALEAFIAKAKVTYIDEDGDNITMTSDAELEEAFLQAAKKFPACTPFRITVTVPRGRSQVYATPRFCGMGAGGKRPVVVRRMPWGDIRQSKKGDASPATAEGDPEATSGLPPPKFEDDLFVHARHTCDGCNKSPIVGTRHRATKIPNFDLCGACFEKYEGDKDLDFKPEIDDCDRLMQQMWLMGHPGKAESSGDLSDVLKQVKKFADHVAYAAKVTPGAAPNPGSEDTGKVHVHFSPPCAGFSGPPKGAQESAQEQDVTSIADVIGRIGKAVVDELEAADNVRAATSCNGKESSPKRGSGQTVEGDVASGVADLFSIASSVVSGVTVALKNMDDTQEAEDDSRDDKMQFKSNDRVLNGADGIAASSEMPSVAGAATMNPGNSTKAPPSLEIPQVEDVSDSGDWSVVSDEEPHAKRDENEADKSVSSTEPLSPVLLAKYDTELFQLHELGFLDDRKNIEVMERLEASYLGSDSTEKVTVQNVVEHLLGRRS